MQNPPDLPLLHRLIQATADQHTVAWLAQQEEKLRLASSPTSFYLAFGSVPRFVAARPLVSGDSPPSNFPVRHWSLRHAARTYLLLLWAEENESSLVATLARLLETADADEQVAVYQSLSLLPNSKNFAPLATHGLRTNITSVFDAIALRNPFPAHYLSEAAWNQMVLKAVFMERPLYLIDGADARANPSLARMLVDFAHERWAAGRLVTPELWRFVAPYVDESHQADLARVMASEDPWERAAGQLASRQALPALRALAPDAPDDLPSWQQIGEGYVEKSE